MENNRKSDAFKIGFSVFMLLAFMTIGEYMLGAYEVIWAAPLWAIAILKAVLIIRDYMHLPRLFSGQEETH